MMATDEFARNDVETAVGNFEEYCSLIESIIEHVPQDRKTQVQRMRCKLEEFWRPEAEYWEFPDLVEQIDALLDRMDDVITVL